jgi:hypothetical protein
MTASHLHVGLPFVVDHFHIGDASDLGKGCLVSVCGARDNNSLRDLAHHKYLYATTTIEAPGSTQSRGVRIASLIVEA